MKNKSIITPLILLLLSAPLQATNTYKSIIKAEGIEVAKYVIPEEITIDPNYWLLKRIK